MLYHIYPDYGNNIYYDCEYLASLGEMRSAEDLPVLVFNLKFTEGALYHIDEGNSDGNFPIPDILKCNFNFFIPAILPNDTNFMLGSNRLISEILSFPCMPHKRYDVLLQKPSEDRMEGFSLVVFDKKVSEITFFPETSIMVSSLSSPLEGEVIKGYCTDGQDFKKKQTELTTKEGKMIRYKEFAIKGNYQVYSYISNSVYVTEVFKKEFDPKKYVGVAIQEIKEVSIKNI